MNEQKRQGLTILALGLVVVGISMGGSLQRALFVPSDIVAALNANPRITSLDSITAMTSQQAAPAEFAASAPAVIPTSGSSSGPMSDIPPAEVPPAALPDAPAVPEAPGATEMPAAGQQFADATPTSGQAPRFGQPVSVSIPTGPDVFGNTPTEPLPEPEVWAMMAAGLLVSGWSLRRRRRLESAST